MENDAEIPPELKTMASGFLTSYCRSQYSFGGGLEPS